MPGKERPDAGRASRAGRPFTIPDMEVESAVIIMRPTGTVSRPALGRVPDFSWEE